MYLLIPLGLLGLLSILVLILIYIIKPKYHEKAVSSTYIWRLSLKYQKKKVPLQWLKRSLLFVLQLLILTSLALMLARPFVMRDTISGEKVIILDASAGMLAEKDGETRFERATREIEKLVERMNTEDRVTVILAGSDASYIVRRADSREQIMASLQNIQCTWGEANIEDAMTLANSVLDENGNAEVILYTDRDYAEPGYVTVRNITDAEWNAAILSVNTELKNGYCKFTAELASYGRDAEVSVSLYVDDALRSEKTVSLKDGEVTPVVWWDEEEVRLFEYATAAVSVKAEDSFPYDNILWIYDNQRQRQVELVSRAPNMLSMALYANPQNDVFPAALGSSTRPDVIYYEGYDLYIFEGKLPARLPEDGGVLLINPEGSFSGLDVGKTVSGSFTAKGTEGISRAYGQLMKGIVPENIHISRYKRAISYDGYEVLMTCKDDPLLLVKNTDGIPVVVLLFDIHYSDLPLLLEFPMLIGNMCTYAAPGTLDKYAFSVGENVMIHTKPNTHTVELRYEGMTGGEETVTRYEAFPIETAVREPGTYTVTQHLSNGKVRTDKFHVRVPVGESDFNARGEVLSGDEYQNPAVGEDGKHIRYNIMEFFKYIAILLLVLLVIEWGVQYREQF